MNPNVFLGVIIPFIGTTLGASCVWLIRNELNPKLQKALLGFAAGVMTAASVWSLLIPAMEQSAPMGQAAWVPAAVGFVVGIVFLLLMDRLIPHLHLSSKTPEGPKTKMNSSTMMALAVTLHNIPEGMAVGVVFAGMLSGMQQITTAGAFALSIGIAIQNFPEGAIVSLPLRTSAASRKKSFLYGMLSGIVEPIAALLTILAASIITPILPYLLAFAAGAMLYVVVEELVPEASAGEHTNIGTIGFAGGFVLMMILDVALG